MLAAWSASPERFREDANAEEDLRLGGYRDRVVVELAQNAADAASADGAPGRLRLSLAESGDGGWVLAAANTGTPLTAAGVLGLATLRASAKRDDDAAAVGRFGVGFAAVLAVTDEPAILSRSGSVRFSQADTVQLVQQDGASALVDEVRRRDGRAPVLRLPFAAEGEPPQGFSTVVLLPLRDRAALEETRRALAEVDDALLLALPGLAEVEVVVDGRPRVLSGAAERWWQVERSGTWTRIEQAGLLRDRPVEEAARPWWSVRWALPRAAATWPRVVHAPTPTDEPLDWPALLMASWPLDPTRRHVAAGPLADRLVVECAAAYAELLAQRVADGADGLPLVPTGLGAGALDSSLRAATLDVLRDAPVLRLVEDGRPVRPRDAVLVDGPVGGDPATLAALAPHLAGLVAAPAGGRTALRALDVRVLSLADVIETLPDAADPAGWRARYLALAPLALEPEGREALAVLPVPLADGRVVRGPRGLALPDPEVEPVALAALAEAGIRVVHPVALDDPAARDLLARLGAVPTTARRLLDDPAVQGLVEDSPEADDPDAVAALVLGLARAAVDAGELGPGDLPWLGDLALADADDELAPANALAVPGSAAERLFDPDEIGVVAQQLVERWGTAVLAAVGVLDGLALVRADEVDLLDPDDEIGDLDGFADWAETAITGAAAVAGEVVAVRDLDAVRVDRLPEAVALIASDPATRRALLDPARVRDDRGRGDDHPSYTAWWLRRRLALDGRLDPAGDPTLGQVLDPAPGWVASLDPEVRRALGVVREAADLGPAAVPLVLERLGDPGREVDPATLLALWAWLARSEWESPSDSAADSPPTRCRALTAQGPSVVAASAACVVDTPMWLQRRDLGGLVVAPAGLGPDLADLLDLDLAVERAPGLVTSTGVPQAVPLVVPLTGAASPWPRQWLRHDDLLVDGVPVQWWVDADGGLHAVDLLHLARAIAWSQGRWATRHTLGDLLTASSPDAAWAMADASYD